MNRQQPNKRPASKRQQPSKPRTATPKITTPTPIQQDTPLSHPPQPTIPTQQPTPLIQLPIFPANPSSFEEEEEDFIEGYCLYGTHPQPTTWLWQDRLPQGNVTLLDGPLSSGKSLLAIHIAACLTSGHPLPDGTPGTPVNNLIFIAPYTSVSHTIRPHLDAAGGDSTRVHILNRVPSLNKRRGSYYHPFTLTLSQDLVILKRTILQLHAPLVILDTPETARPALLRRILPDLIDLAERTNCAILLIRPTPQRPITRTNDTVHPSSDPLDLLAAIPSRLLIAPNPINPQQSLLISSKRAFKRQPPILLFDTTTSPHGTTILTWQGHYQPPAISDDTPTPARYSLHRQHLLEHLHANPTPQDALHLAVAIDHSYEATRKLLQYMLHDGQLISPTRGLYTTPNHPTQTPQTLPESPSTRPSIPILPNVPNATDHTPDPSVPVPSLPSIPPGDVATPESPSTLPSIPILPNATAYNPDTYQRDASLPSLPDSDVATTASTSTLPTLPILPNVVPNTNGHSTPGHST